MFHLLKECLYFGQALTLLRNLLYLFMTVSITGCITSGGGDGGSYSANWNPCFSGQPALSIVMVLLANMLNSIARQVNTPTCVIASEWSMTQLIDNLSRG